MFKSIRTHVLVENEIKRDQKGKFKENKAEILDSLKNGKCFISNYYHGDARGFRFFAEKKNDVYNMGDSVNIDSTSKATFKIFAPKDCIIKLIHNGNKVNEKEGINAVWDIDKTGVYRVECWINNKGWIFSNHIRVTNSA